MGKYNVDIYFYDETLFCVLFFCFCFRSFYNIILINLNMGNSVRNNRSFTGTNGTKRNSMKGTKRNSLNELKKVGTRPALVIIREF